MALKNRIRVGDRLPSTPLAELVNGEIRVSDVERRFAGQRVVIVGVPGAFTPVCTRIHIPKFVEETPALLRSGFDAVVCVAPNNPWTVYEWGRQLDPEGRMRFLSDGNLAFVRAAGLTTNLPDLFVGECCERFVLIAKNCIVEKVSVERSVFDVGCTAAGTCVIEA